MTDPRLSTLLAQLARAFDRRSWHGTNLLGSIRRLDPKSAAWRPAPGRHNAWEIVVHAAYWKYRVVRLIAAEPPAAFTIPGSDWFSRPEEATERALKMDVELLLGWHRRLVAAVEALDPARLDERATSEWTYLDFVAGAAAHDLYHAGQIQLLRRLRSGAAGDPPPAPRAR